MQRHNFKCSSLQQARKSWSTSLTDPTPEEVVVKTLKCWKETAEAVQHGRSFTKNEALCRLDRESENAAAPGGTFLTTPQLCDFLFTLPGSPCDKAVTGSAPHSRRQKASHPAGISTAPSSCLQQVFALRHSSHQIPSGMRVEGSGWRFFNILRLAAHLKTLNPTVGGWRGGEGGGGHQYNTSSYQGGWISLSSSVESITTLRGISVRPR